AAALRGGVAHDPAGGLGPEQIDPVAEHDFVAAAGELGDLHRVPRDRPRVVVVVRGVDGAVVVTVVGVVVAALHEHARVVPDQSASTRGAGRLLDPQEYRVGTTGHLVRLLAHAEPATDAHHCTLLCGGQDPRS